MREINYYINKMKKLGIKKTISLGYSKLMYSLYPSIINVEIMNKCNLKCKHCRVTYHGNIMEEVAPGFLDYAYFTKIVDRISPLIKKAHTFQFSSVEPLFHKDIFKMMDYVSRYNKSIEYPLSSNGMLLTEKNINELLKRNIPSISISLDGCKKETVESFKTNTNFDRVVSNIKRLKILCQKKIEVYTVFVATSKNIHEIVEYISFCKNLNIDRILVNGFVSYLPENSHLYLYSKQGNPEVNKIFRLAYDNAKKQNIDIEFPSLIAKPLGCGMYINMNINEKGDVFPCILLARKTPFELFSKTATVDPVIWGNIFDDDPLSIWRSRKNVQFRKMLKNKVVPNECSLCSNAYGVISSNRNSKIK